MTSVNDVKSDDFFPFVNYTGECPLTFGYLKRSEGVQKRRRIRTVRKKVTLFEIGTLVETQDRLVVLYTPTRTPGDFCEEYTDTFYVF